MCLFSNGNMFTLVYILTAKVACLSVNLVLFSYKCKGNTCFTYHFFLYLQQRVLEKNGIRFAANMNNPSAVAKVLMQEPGKLKVNEMRESKTIFHSLS